MMVGLGALRVWQERHDQNEADKQTVTFHMQKARSCQQIRKGKQVPVHVAKAHATPTPKQVTSLEENKRIPCQRSSKPAELRDRTAFMVICLPSMNEWLNVSGASM